MKGPDVYESPSAAYTDPAAGVADAWPPVVGDTATKAANAVETAHSLRRLSPRLRPTSTSCGRAAVVGGEVLRGGVGSLPERVPIPAGAALPHATAAAATGRTPGLRAGQRLASVRPSVSLAIDRGGHHNRAFWGGHAQRITSIR